MSVRVSFVLLLSSYRPLYFSISFPFYFYGRDSNSWKNMERPRAFLAFSSIFFFLFVFPFFFLFPSFFFFHFVNIPSTYGPRKFSRLIDANSKSYDPYRKFLTHAHDFEIESRGSGLNLPSFPSFPFFFFLSSSFFFFYFFSPEGSLT